MSALEAVVLGLVQGLTEFLPVSSSGHLTLAEKALGIEMDDVIALDVALHGATLAAILVYFARTWVKRLAAEPYLAALALAAGVPAGALYLAGGERAVEAAKASLPALGALFAAAGGFLAFASVRASRSGPGGAASDRTMPGGKKGALAVGAIGLAQAAALFPGVSRSGATMGAGLLCGLSREAAFEFSFLAGAPLMAGALVMKGAELREIASASGGALAAGAAVAFVSGLAALALLRCAAARGKLWPFGAYTVLVGTGCLVWATAGSH